MIAPLLPTIAEDLGMALSATATRVVVFTLAMSLSCPITSLKRLSTQQVAITLFTTGDLVAAYSSSFATLMNARILVAIASGLYVPGAKSLAGVIVSPEKRGRALAIVSGGKTIAIALGLPLSNTPLLSSTIIRTVRMAVDSRCAPAMRVDFPLPRGFCNQNLRPPAFHFACLATQAR